MQSQINGILILLQGLKSIVLFDVCLSYILNNSDDNRLFYFFFLNWDERWLYVNNTEIMTFALNNESKEKYKITQKKERDLRIILVQNIWIFSPRKEIMTMLRDAHMKHLMSDKYKKHLQSVPSGNAIPRSPEGYFGILL